MEEGRNVHSRVATTHPFLPESVTAEAMHWSNEYILHIHIWVGWISSPVWWGAGVYASMDENTPCLYPVLVSDGVGCAVCVGGRNQLAVESARLWCKLINPVCRA
jgi:hypothetical protein